MERGEARITDAGNALSVSYEDCDVEIFGGSDYEASYFLDAAGRNKLERELKKEGLPGTLKDMILAYFGTCLEKESFAAYCDEHGIRYNLHTWIS